jgi:uncharacterized protein YggE
MKKMLWSFLAFALLAAVPAARAIEPDASHIGVYGTATIEVIPNQMIWMLTARNINPSSAGAAKAHETTVGEVLAFLKQNRIAESKIQTSRMQLSENMKFVRGESIQDGYLASTDIQFTLADLSRYASIWTGLSGISGVRVNNVSLDHSDRIKFQNEARTTAVLAARDKAKAIAETLGLRLEKPLSVEEDLSSVEGYRALMPVSNPIFSNEVRAAGSPAGSGESIAPGTIAIRSRVKATFAFAK